MIYRAATSSRLSSNSRRKRISTKWLTTSPMSTSTSFTANSGSWILTMIYTYQLKTYHGIVTTVWYMHVHVLYMYTHPVIDCTHPHADWLYYFYILFVIILSSSALNEFVVERLVSGVVTRNKTTPKGQMGYKDFVWFLLSDEDKTTPRR